MQGKELVENKGRGRERERERERELRKRGESVGRKRG